MVEAFEEADEACRCCVLKSKAHRLQRCTSCDNIIDDSHIDKDGRAIARVKEVFESVIGESKISMDRIDSVKISAPPTRNA